MENNQLFIFFHIPKCAGTTINFHIKKNFKKEEFLYLSKNHGFYNLQKNNYEMLEDKETIDIYLNSLSEEQKNKIKVISGHEVYYDIHKLFPNRTPIYLTFIRDPFKRIISQYKQYKKVIEKNEEINDEIGSITQKSNQLEARKILSINENICNFEEWIKSDLCANNQISKNLFLERFIEKKSFKEINEEDLKEGLKKFYFIGIVEKSREDMDYLSHILNFKKFYSNKNLSIDKSIKKISKIKMKELEEIFISKNQLDKEIYEIAVEMNKEFKNSNRNFNKISKRQRLKRRIILPITNSIYLIERLMKI